MIVHFKLCYKKLMKINKIIYCVSISKGPDTKTVDEKYDKDASYNSDSSDDIDLEYLEFSKKTLEHQEKISKLANLATY